MISKQPCRSTMNNKGRAQRLVQARFRARAQRGYGQTERGLELLRQAADEPNA